MEKYDFTNYYHLLKSFDYEQDAYNPYDEFYQEYIKYLMILIQFLNRQK